MTSPVPSDPIGYTSRAQLARGVLPVATAMADERTVSLGPKEWQLAYGAALRILGVPDRAEDAAQNALLHAFRARRSFRGEAAFSTWLYRIAVNAALEELRRERRRGRFVSLGETDSSLDRRAPASAPESRPDALVAAAELASCLVRILADLEPVNRHVFTEIYLAGRSRREVAERGVLSAGAVNQRAFRSRRTVRRRVAAAGFGRRDG